MTPERWRQIESVLAGALERDGTERERFVAQACGMDRALEGEVRALLAHEHDGERVLSDAVQGAAVALLESDAPQLGERERIGAYRIIREIGRGGMGTVYLAERDDEFRKRVAIKLVTRGMDTAELLERFRHERQILARLEHPYIARLLDGGSTEDARPYLVMEYVEGTPITTHCDEHRLGTRQRVELFRKVCAAVQSAHQQLVVHRDLKPANMLVAADGSPKLLDFGIAKLVDPGAVADATAATGARMLTPDYASPEQVQGQPVTTATDVYALGVILYELVSGVRPHRLDSYTPAEIERAVCYQEPEKPSTARKRAAAPGSGKPAPALEAGDLDNIVLMAMQKEPARRYASVAELSDDLRRYLNGLPVLAREDTLRYRTWTFIRRHRTGVAAAAALVLSLAGGVTVSTIEARRAERRFNEVRRLAHAVLYDVHDAIRDLPGSTHAREVVVNTALHYLDGLAAEANGDPDIQLELAEAYKRVGDVQGHAIEASLGHTDQALASYRKAMAIGDELAARLPSSSTADLVRVEARQQIGEIHARRRNDVATALAVYDEAVRIGEALQRRDPSNHQNLQLLSALYTQQARDEPNRTRGIAAARKALPILEQLAAEHPADEEAQQALSDGYSMTARGLTSGNELEPALEYLKKSLHVRERLAAARPDNARHQRQLMIGYSRIGDLMGPYQPSLEDPAGALEYCRKTLDIAERLSAADPDNPRVAFDLGMAVMKLGIATPTEADEAAVALFQRSIGIFQTLAGADPRDHRSRVEAAFAYEFLGQRQARLGRPIDAAASYRTAMNLDEQELPSHDMSTLRALWVAYRELAKLDASVEHRAEVLPLANRAIAVAESARHLDPTNAITQTMLPEAYATKGDILSRLASAERAPLGRRREDWAAARDAFALSAAGWEQITPQHGWPRDRDTQLSSMRREVQRCIAALAALH